MPEYGRIAILLALPLVDLGRLGGVVLADGCILLTYGHRSPRLFSWTLMLGFGLLVTCIVAMVVLAPALH